MALWGQWPYLLILFVWEFGGWWDVSVLWGQYLHHRHRDLQIIHLILDCLLLLQRVSLFFDDFDYRLQGQHCPYAILPYIVDWLLQWSKDYSDTTVFGWPTLRMWNRMSCFYIEVWSYEMLSLCGKLIWRWNVVFRLCFVFRRRLYRIPCMNHFVLEKLTLVLALPIS